MKAAQTKHKPMFMDEPRPEELLSEQIFTGRILTINRPESLNALNASLAKKVSRAVKGMNQGAVTAFFVLRGSGSANLSQKVIVTERDRFFCTGTDLLALTNAWDSGDRESVKEYHAAEAEMVSTLVNCTKPWAAGMDGAVLGAGTGLAMHALFRFASTQSTWAIPETAYGGVPGYGASFQLHNLDGSMGTFLALTGRRLVGQDLVWAGVASNVVDPVLYSDLCTSVTHQNSIELQHLVPVVASYDSQREMKEVPYALEPHLETIDSCFGEESVERIKEKLREVGSDFAAQTLRKLETRSPAALKLTLRLLREGQRCDDIGESLAMEYAVRMRLWEDEGSDFHYGLTNVVYGKTPRVVPQWPKDATDAYVESMFAPMKEGLGSVVQLAPLAPRPPLEAPQLLQHHSDVYIINNAPPLTAAQLGEQRREETPVERAEVRPEEELMEEALSKNMHKLLRPVRNWFVRPAADAAKPSAEVAALVEAAGQGEVFVALNARTGESIQVPEAIKRELMRKYKRLREWQIFFMDTYDPHPSLRPTGESAMARLHSALRNASGLPRDGGQFATDRVLSSESMEEVMGRAFFSADEEMEAYLALAGFKPRDENAAEEEFLAKGLEEEVVDRRPLTDRERQL